MNNFIKQVIEEKFESKNEDKSKFDKFKKSLKFKKTKKKLSKNEKKDSDKEEEVDEIVDSKGNIQRSKINPDVNTKGITQKKMTDDVVTGAYGQMGSYGVTGTQNYRRFWGEGKVVTKEKLLEIAMDDTLGFEKTMGQDKTYDEAKLYFKKELKLSDEEVEERLSKMGYDEKLPEDQVRLVENPKKYMEDYIESILSKKNNIEDIVDGESEIKEVNPIIKKQIKALKNSMDSNNLSINDILTYLKDNE